MISYNLILKSVSVYPLLGNYENVVKRVIWNIEFFDTEYPDVKSVGSVDTMLNTDDINSFIEIENLTNDDILIWALETQGDQDFINSIQSFHEERLQRLIIESQLVKYDI